MVYRKILLKICFEYVYIYIGIYIYISLGINGLHNASYLKPGMHLASYDIFM